MSPRDSEQARVCVASRLRDAGVSTWRFIDVHDGEKRSTDHTRYPPDAPHLTGNYGIYSGRGQSTGSDASHRDDSLWLVDVDVDNYRNDEMKSVLTDGLDSLPATFTIESPHTDGKTGGHRYYAVRGHVANEFNAQLGIKNPAPEWGEVRVSNQYCVGPGSQIEKGPHGCDKEWCKECGSDNGGYYRIADNRPIAIVDCDRFVDAILTDLPNQQRTGNATRGAVDTAKQGGQAETLSPGPGLPDDVDIEQRLVHALKTDDLLQKLWNGEFSAAGYPDDRSEAEYTLAGRLGWWFGQDPTTVRQLMNRANTQKWCIRTDTSYRDSILAIVGGDDYYEPASCASRKPVVELPDFYRPKTRWGSLRAQDSRNTSSDTNAPTIGELRQTTQVTIGRAMASGKSVVIDAIMGAGKTYGTFAAANDLNEPLLYTAPRTDLYLQGVEYAEDVGFDTDDVLILPRPQDCPTFRGDHGKEWKQRVWSLYRLGASASTIHAMLADELPCCAKDDSHLDEPLCDYQRKNQYEPSEFDVIIGHYKHAHIDPVTFGRAAVFDEAPADAFLTELRGETLIQAVNAFLSDPVNDIPVKGFDDLLQVRNDTERRQKALAWFDAARDGGGIDLLKADERGVVNKEGSGYHSSAPHAVYAILASKSVEDAHDLYDEESSDGYEFKTASLPGYRHRALFFASNGTFECADGVGYYVQIQTPPNLEDTKSIIALDGTPMLDTWTTGKDDPRPAEWERALGRHLGYNRILSDNERAAFLRHTMGHTYIQTTEHIRPYSSGNWNDKASDAALLAAISDRYLHGAPVDVTITSKRVKQDYLNDGFTDNSRRLTREIVHTGEVRGSNRYAKCDSGVILGSSHHGDHEVARRAALLGARIQPDSNDGDRAYGPTGDAVRYQMREQDIAQVALRIGRGENGKGALVALHTAAIPDWIPVINRDYPGKIRTWSTAERAVAKTISEEATADTTDGGRLIFRTDELRELVDSEVTKRHFRRILSSFADRGLLRKENDPEDGRRNVWIDVCLSSYTADRAVSVSLPEVNPDITSGDTDIFLIESSLAECPYFTAESDGRGSFRVSSNQKYETVRRRQPQSFE